MTYQTLQQLQKHKAQLLDHTQLGSGMQLASWYNQHDRIGVCSDHHTLSLYIQGGYESYQKRGLNWHNGGGPDHFCLMPQHQASEWDIRGELSFVHLYYTDQHLRDLATNVWDKEPNTILLDEKTFAVDPQITLLYRHFLLNCDWQQSENLLQLSTTATLLLNHILRNYSNIVWNMPHVKGGLAPATLRLLLEWIEANLHLPLTISDLAAQAHLSDYHFAHMFRHSMQQAPHQYILQQRLMRAHQLIQHSTFNLTEVAFQCGFSSASHFSNRFKQHFGCTPSQLRGSC
ncbi:AraC family transcriptional regulator [Acinetobacter sp. MB5]|uniref:AraC family transcriptional regulator n=1 Tax=Acinetobacter sp. MB5 TaxID=2069438 RepID=UPI000DD01B81|nr:AraC family transcriptional regulator [Acinetobacter sp. MB5]